MPAALMKGANVLVTGASSGLGEHFARVLANAGANVAVAARRREKLQRLASELSDVGINSIAVGMDVTDRASVVDAVVTESERSKARQLAARKQASEEHGPFVANAAFRKVNRHELPARQCAASDDDVGEHAEV